MPRSYVLKKYEELFFAKQISIDEYLENIRSTEIKNYRVKTIKSGEMLEVEIYPVYKKSQSTKIASFEPSRVAQQNLNYENRKKYITRLVNTNFNNAHMWATFDYSHIHMPTSPLEAQKNIQNYFRRLKRHIKKNKLEELKYIYVTEWVENEKTGKIHAHHHIIMNFADRDKAEELWEKGHRLQTRRLQSDDYGLEGLARYIAKEETKNKDKKGVKSYVPSKNLEKPKMAISDHKISKRKASQIAENENTAKEIFENLYKDYKFNDIKVKYSDYVAGAFIYTRMKQSHTNKVSKKRRN